jgi:hypothetical protein
MATPLVLTTPVNQLADFYCQITDFGLKNNH